MSLFCLDAFAAKCRKILLLSTEKEFAPDLEHSFKVIFHALSRRASICGFCPTDRLYPTLNVETVSTINKAIILRRLKIPCNEPPKSARN